MIRDEKCPKRKFCKFINVPLYLVAWRHEPASSRGSQASCRTPRPYVCTHLCPDARQTYSSYETSARFYLANKAGMPFCLLSLTFNRYYHSVVLCGLLVCDLTTTKKKSGILSKLRVFVKIISGENLSPKHTQIFNKTYSLTLV